MLLRCKADRGGRGRQGTGRAAPDGSTSNVLCLENLDHGVPSIAGGWDLIYSTGLLTGLPWVAARQILRTALFRLKPGGRLIFANVQADAHVIRCAACRRNSISGRTEFQMIELAAGLRPDVVAAQLVYSDGCGMNTFLELHKDTAGLPQSSEHVTDGAFLERAIRSAV